MAAAAIINSGRNKIALQQGSSQLLNVTKFVFANIPGLVVTDPVNLAQGMPSAGNIVAEREKTAQGYVASDQVVYSVILTPDDGNFTFNWVGLVDADNILIGVAYTAPIPKYKTVGLSVGNTITRNFLLQFNNAVATTGIAVSAATWQIDFIGRLNSIDETIRADMRDIFGSGLFLGDGFQIVSNAGVVTAKAGVGYVGGYRAVLSADSVIAAGVLPKDIYVDCMLEGGMSSSTVTSTLRASAPGAPLVDFTDGNNRKHYVVKIATISAASAVTDLRATLPSNIALIDYLFQQLALRAPIDSPLFTGNPKAPTPAKNDNDTSLANTAFAQSLVRGNLVKTTVGGTTTLSDVEASTPIITVNGALTSNAVLVLPATLERVWAITNATTGAYTLTVRTAAGGGVVVTSGKRAIVQCTGVDIKPAFTDFDSIELSGVSTAPTPAAGTNTKQIVNAEFVQAAIAVACAALVSSAPDLLNTLDEIAAALGDDPNFRTTMLNLLAAKAPLNSPALTGIPTLPTAAVGTNTTQGASTAFVQVAIGLLAAVARTGSAADLTGTLPAARLPFSYGTAMTGGFVAQRDAAGNILVPDVPLNESSAKAVNSNFVISCVNAAFTTLVGASPALLNTIDELANALGDDPNFRTTMLNLLAAKAPLNSPALTGNPTMPTAPLGTKTTQGATTEFINNFVSLSALKWSGSAVSVSLASYGNGFYLVKTNSTNSSNNYFLIHYMNGCATVGACSSRVLGSGDLIVTTCYVTATGTLTAKDDRVSISSTLNITEVLKIGG